MKIKITEMNDGRFEAQYLNKAHIGVNGICQYGKTAVEAEVNLKALLNAIRKKQLIHTDISCLAQ